MLVRMLLSLPSLLHCTRRPLTRLLSVCGCALVRAVIRTFVVALGAKRRVHISVRERRCWLVHLCRTRGLGTPTHKHE